MADFSSPYTGPTFDIIAGSEHMHFTAHATVLEQSDHLKAVIHGKWKDSLERKIVLEDWDSASVGRMLQWLYSGDYEAPSPTLPDSYETAAESHEQDSDDWGAFFAQPTEPTFTVLLARLMSTKLSSPAKRTEAETLESWMQSAGVARHDIDYEYTLMAHAKLYVLANYMLLPGLQAFTFERLQKLLSTMHPIKKDKPVITNLINFIEYVHVSTTRPDVGEEPLQELTATFIALNFSQFNDGDGKVQRLMHQCRDFAENVLDKVRSIMADIYTLRTEIVSL
ncbi:hypothetical protein BDR22DRAFT_712154 [Usnea florida]